MQVNRAQQALGVAPRDPRWQYWVQSARPELEGKLGSTFALSNGLLGLRGAPEECPAWSRPEFYIAGTYAGGPATLLGFHDPDHILTDPAKITPQALAEVGQETIWTLPNLPFPIGVRLEVGGVPFAFATSKILSHERLLDMGAALVRRCLVFRDRDGRRTRVDSVRFVSLANPNLVGLQYRVQRLGHEAPLSVQGYLHTEVANTNQTRLWQPGRACDEPGRHALECVTLASGLHLAIAQQAVTREEAGAVVLELFAVAGPMSLDEALAGAAAAASQGFAACRDAHRAAYGAQRAAAAVEFDDNAALVQGFNFGQMHLQMAFGPSADKTGVPIKGLTGHGYRFLNFWDTDFHMFPYYLMTRPRDARKLLEYRYGQLDRYRENARRWGTAGAQVPWETNTRGVEETAPWLCLPNREIHISAEAAAMFQRYADLTGDDRVLAEMGAEFAFETARFYASRLRWNERRGKYDLPDVGCSDQYHTVADNNLFISQWARWNLDWAAELFGRPACRPAARKIGVTLAEARRWRERAAKLYLIAPNADGIIEEFEGFFRLATDLEGICETYCRHSQAVKQPDVLAAFIPFEDQYPLEIRQRNWRFYNARTLHGSSLSLPGMAYAAARCGLTDEALDQLHRSSRMDLDDVNLDTERGIHVSGGAVAWSAVVFGFGGLTARRDGLRFQPNLPRRWRYLKFTVHWRFQPVRIEITPRRLRCLVGTDSDTPVLVRVGQGKPRRLRPGTTHEFRLAR